jgi:hypothetical protein
MVWWNPLSWFSRSAQTVLANANTSVLKNALRNYIKAVNNLPNKNNAYIYGLMMKTANGANASYKNRFTNGIAKIVAASRRGIVQAANAVANGAPEGPAAAAVNNATAKINNLNRRMAELNTLLPPGATATPNNMARLYMAKKHNNVANRAINTAGKYASIWAAINALKTSATAPALNEVNRMKKINAALGEINAAGNNINKLRGIKTRLNNAGFNRGQAAASVITKYDIISNKLAANKALKNAEALTVNSNQATINSVLNQLRKVQNRVPNTMRTRISNKIANVERQSLLKTPKPLNQ